MKQKIIILIFTFCLLIGSSFKLTGQEKSLIDCLESLHYSSIQLTPNIMGQFEMEATLDGHPIVLIVDTGASQSILSKSFLDSLNYETFPVEDPEGREFWRVRIDSLSFGNANTGRREILAANLEDLFPGFNVYGNRIQGLIGSDILSRYSALVDIEWSKLYIRIR